MKPYLNARYAILVLLFLAACRKDTLIQPLNKGPETGVTVNAVTLSENFESGSKGAYAAGNVSLSSGSWYFDEALIGNLSGDAKSGSQSVRIRNTGSITMNFNGSGAASISIKHAVFGSDGSSTWQLWVSTNGGSSFTQVGNTVTSSSTSLQTASFTVNISGSFRLSVRKISGGSNRINIDDITVSTGSGGGGSAPGDDDHLLLGNPSNAVTDISFPANYLMVKTYYALSYNRDRGTPNWVSWHLSTAELGSTSRQDDFHADNTLPGSWYHVSASSFSGSGFDRGHNCPSADRTSSVSANSSTFLMTNMIPQAPNNNQRTWNNLEGYARSLVSSGNEVYIIMGSYGVGGTGSNGTVNTIDGGRVTVPSHVWKVLVVLPSGNNDLSRVNTSTRVIAVNTPNINTVNSDWKQYRTSVDAIEGATGYNLLSNLPASVQDVVEGEVDDQ